MHFLILHQIQGKCRKKLAKMFSQNLPIQARRIWQDLVGGSQGFGQIALFTEVQKVSYLFTDTKPEKIFLLTQKGAR